MIGYLSGFVAGDSKRTSAIFKHSHVGLDEMDLINPGGHNGTIEREEELSNLSRESVESLRVKHPNTKRAGALDRRVYDDDLYHDHDFRQSLDGRMDAQECSCGEDGKSCIICCTQHDLLAIPPDLLSHQQVSISKCPDHPGDFLVSMPIELAETQLGFDF